MLTMLQRVCWNTSGWRVPTGQCRQERGYPAEWGFGYEEWNFQLEDACDGWVYGYLKFRPADRKVKESGGLFEIGFWTLHPETKQKLLIGWYHSAQLTTEQDLRQLDRHFRSAGIYERRATELISAVPNIGQARARREVIKSVRKHALRFKCQTGHVEALSHPIPLPDKISLSQHFNRPTYIDPQALRALPRGRRKLIPGGSRQVPLAEDGYYREIGERSLLILRKHNRLSNRFREWLKREGFKGVSREQNRVDVEFTDRGQLFRAELKTCYPVGTTKAIREALGQLLEYNYYGERQPADQWLIVLDQEPSSQDKAYIKTLRERLRLPLSLGWQTPEGTFEFERAIRSVG